MADTIYALATAPGKAGVSIVRISGPGAFHTLEALGARRGAARVARLQNILDGDGTVLDQALTLTFEAGASFTGEDVVELHLHGSIAVQRATLRRISEIGLARPAEAGEFTRRALINGRMDLTEVQGLADVIEAETEEQRRAAMRVLNGQMSDLVLSWRTRIVRASALLEATIDFADEEVPVDVLPEVMDLLGGVLGEMQAEVDGVSAAQSLRDGFTVAIVGAPNAGKSSLLNAIARSEVALVSEIAGTTRDVIERAIDLRGYKVLLSDTAGLRETDDPIEKLGVQRAERVARGADLRIFLHEEAEPPAFPIARQDGDLVRRSKCDLHGEPGLSARTGEGLETLLSQIADRLEEMAGSAGFVSRERDRAALISAIDILSSVTAGGFDQGVEFVVSDLRSAIRNLERVVGKIDVEDVLDEVFRSFCLGK
ncbi:tRNA uridine-5-carboxymethylaminomethyl(34) synthesis GTPase MnmE [Jannaschia seohaensis]|uniref:tRNA modification GTPase MnmE n=1 Tax=Jannaschia seohaensis TaxID=475081 RepID=A0A2Y9A169_9RHOB|nr:tRNA uridine-5-carboxymethylaminomethyl(34) synthesis GTPase MnmE [Jannaschia seohaensis]PWJ21757.1 tRNA modification GTPase [Jannaschia seohaensis]SSA38035.1 tRNA modification GTPase [Jannaschia seohaensis]